MAVLYGGNVHVFMDGIVIAKASSHTIDMPMSVRATSSKDTGKFDTEAAGRMKVTATINANIADDYVNIQAMRDAYFIRQPVHLEFAERLGATLGVDGDYVGNNPDESKTYAEGNFYITNLSENYPDDNATYTASFSISDATFVFSTDITLRVGVFGTNSSGADDGFAACFPKGGTTPYGFSWDTVPATGVIDTTQGIAALEAGTYRVTVTDAVMATVVADVIITEPAP
jgi:hypothetical protein